MEMRTTVPAHGGNTKSLKCLLLLIALTLILVPPVTATMVKEIPVLQGGIYNKSYVLSDDGSTPFSLWSGAIILGIVLVLLSFMSGIFPNGEEGLVSILAWIPISYALYTSFAVDMLTGFGVSSQPIVLQNDTTYEFVLMEAHTVYHFDAVAVCLFILLAFAVGNTYRIWISQKKLNQLTETEM